MGDITPPGWPGRVAVAVIHSVPPEVVLATDANVLTRVLALRYVAKSPVDALPVESVRVIRAALLAERWDIAVAAWMEATGESIDAYPDDEVWDDAKLDHQLATIEMKASPIFEGDLPPAPDGEEPTFD